MPALQQVVGGEGPGGRSRWRRRRLVRHDWARFDAGGAVTRSFTGSKVTMPRADRRPSLAPPLEPSVTPAHGAC